MTETDFAARPWRALPNQLDADSQSMITANEARLLHWLTRECYDGLGEIVELGSFMGASTNALASGLAANRRVEDKAGRIHCFDLFQHFEGGPPWLQEVFRREDVGPGESFINSFLRRTQPHAPLLRVHPGSIFDQIWAGYPIEILFVDAAKTWPLNDATLRSFYAGLMPGRSLVVHQDFLFSGCPWVAILMAKLRDHFDLVMEDCPSLVFRCRKRVPESVLRDGITRLPPAEKLALFASWRETFLAHGLEADFLMGQVILLISFNRRDEARELAADTWRKFPHLFDPDGWFRTAMRLWGFPMEPPDGLETALP